MSKYSQRIEALEHNEKKKKILFGTIIATLIIIFLTGMIFGAVNILQEEGTENPYEKPMLEPIDLYSTANDAIDGLNNLLNTANDKNKTKLNIYTDIWIGDNSLTCSGNSTELENQINHIKQALLDSIKKYYPTFESKFGEDFTEKKILLSIDQNDISTFSAKRGQINGEGNVIDKEKCFYNIRLKPIDYDKALKSEYNNSLGMDTSVNILDSVTNELKPIANITDFKKILCTDFAIEADTDTHGRINKIAYVRGYDITFTAEFVNEFADFGAIDISFCFYAKENHIYTWAGLELKDKEIRIEKGKTEALEVYKSADENINVSWTSSNPEIATVDEKGYVKGHKLSEDSVTITVEFQYLGNTYTDSCEVYVRKPVTEIKTSPRELELKVDETGKLNCKISPKNATINLLIWKSENEEIATVDENGIVTALKPGSTKVYAISDDGHFRSSCLVTVIE